MDFQKHTLAFASWLIVAIVAQFVVTDPRLRAAEDALMAVAAASAAWDEAFNFEGNAVEHHTVNATRHAAGDTVVERAEYTLTIRPKDGSAPAQEEGKHIVVHARQADGSWKVMWEIWNAAR
jgi:ketosteroid isomerase-like protein